HNLFGDTDSVNVRLTNGGYAFSHVKRGDTTDVMLDYVGYKLDDLRAAYRGKIAAAQLPADDAEHIAAALEAGLTGYTYLAEG
ncbi:MAG TPA: arginine decarboxylase, partial [Rudaea sp.]|nr:arginine decarboxylase [Rudaea sp.]